MKERKINSSRMPVYRDSGFQLFDAGTTSGVFKNETEHQREPDLYIYSRYRNPTVVAAEEEVMKVEKCNWALLTQTGMSAIDIAVSVFQEAQNPRPWLFFTEIYGGTISFIESVLKRRRGIDVHSFSPENGTYDLKKFEELLIKLKPAFVYAETVSNPLLVVTDIPSVIKLAKKHGARVIIDNTFATPLLYRPLEDGADIVIHSATKYFSGHGNLTAGVLCGNDQELMKQAIEYRKFVGHMLSPDEAYRLTTQIKTLRLRFDKQCENASRLAQWLSSNGAIEKVFFPGLQSHETHRQAVSLFGEKQFGAMITVDFAGRTSDEKRDKRDRFISLVAEKIKLIPTLGDPETIIMPVESVWGAKYPEPGMLRISVGFEEYQDLFDTVSGAVARL
ncbi:MAG: aminotransferase class V-fold PLP-dependent enzyme [Bacteroidales bacterium]